MDSFFESEAANNRGLDPTPTFRTIEGLYTTLNGLSGRLREGRVNSLFEGFMDPVSGHRVGSGRVIWTNGDEFEGEFEGDHALSGSFISKRHSLKYIGGFDVEGKFLTR
jgi:hypothetical protein